MLWAIYGENLCAVAAGGIVNGVIYLWYATVCLTEFRSKHSDQDLHIDILAAHAICTPNHLDVSNVPSPFEANKANKDC